MQSTREIAHFDQKTASQRGGYSHKPVSPVLFVVLACVILAFVWTKIITSPVSVLAAGTTTGTNPLLSHGNDGEIVSLSSENTQNSLSKIFTPEVLYWGDQILVWSENSGLDPNLVATVMQIESCGDPLALSRAGAMGLFQVMPYHFAVGEDPYDTETNARRGLDYLQRAMQTGENSVRLALAGYNGGIGVIGLSESEWQDQTVRYVFWGTGIYDDTVNGVIESVSLQDWYRTSGASLCAQAHDRLGMLP
jgi:hypothetical protein